MLLNTRKVAPRTRAPNGGSRRMGRSQSIRAPSSIAPPKRMGGKTRMSGVSGSRFKAGILPLADAVQLHELELPGRSGGTNPIVDLRPASSAPSSREAARARHDAHRP